MDELKRMVKSKMQRSTIIIAVIVLAVILVICYLIFGKNGLFKLQQNIYFMEWDNQKDETIFYRYNAENDVVDELGRISGSMHYCVVNKDETCLIGLSLKTEGQKRIRFELVTGTFQTEDIGEKIDALTGGGKWRTLLLYDEGNKILISYEEGRNDQWLFYDFVTDEYSIIEGGKYKADKFLAFNDNEVWYVTGATLRKYNLETGKDTKILYSFNSAAVAPDKEIVYYVESGIYDKKIYRYNVETNMIKCMLSAGWNTYYGDMFEKEGQWSDDENYFFYVKYYPLLFSASNISLMVYNTRTGRSFCIYKEWNTYHEFRYIGSSG